MSADTMRRNLQRFLLLVATCVVTAPAFAQRGAMTVPRNLDQLTDRAADILRGTVVSARVEKHPELTNLDTIVVTLRVQETLKGQSSGTFTFRQYIWDIRDRRDAAGYRKGQQYLLLMNAPSRHGLTSPAGMELGRFRLSRDATGREVAVNGRGNVLLMSGLSSELAKSGVVLSPSSMGLVSKHQKGAIAADELAGLIRELVQEGR
jgi:hypothetical protein